MISDYATRFRGLVRLSKPVLLLATAGAALLSGQSLATAAPPVAVDDTVVIAPGDMVDIDVLANDADPEGGTLSLLALGRPSAGVATIVDGGAVSYVADADAVGSDSFIYFVSDEAGEISSALVLVVLVPAAEEPPADEPSADEPPADEPPPAEEPPAVEPPVEDPAADEPPVSGPPIHEPPVVEPPVDEPPVSEPPMDEPAGEDPPLAEPPMQEPPVDGPIADDPPVVPSPSGDRRTPWSTEPWWRSEPPGLFGDPAKGSYREWWEYTSTTTVDRGDGVIETYEERGGYETTLGLGGDGDAGDGAAADEPNAAPIATDDVVLDPGDPSFVIDALRNDIDPDGDALVIVSVGGAAQGIASHDDAVVTYTPRATAAGFDSFTYTIHDGRGGFATGTITVTFAAAGPPPGADDEGPGDSDDAPPLEDPSAEDPPSAGPPPEDPPLDEPAVDEPVHEVPGADGTVTIGAGESIRVLTGASVEGGLVLVAHTDPFSGSLIENADGTLIYTPNAGFTGIDVFSWTLEWPHGGTAKTTMVVRVVASAP